MPLLNNLKQLLRPARSREYEPAAAYDRWAEAYDDQPDNLMLALDSALCGQLLSPLSLAGATIADIGCGTGRHWSRLLARAPGRLAGFDVSTGMLNRLHHKFPGAETHVLSGTALTTLDTASCDLVFSTLTIAHVANLSATLTEWCRVLKPGGDMIITDYHPAALARGGQRTFREGEKLIAVRNHVYPVGAVVGIAASLGLCRHLLIEKRIDESVRGYYEKQNALHVFRRFNGVPIIYGLHLKKRDAAQ